MARSSKLLQPVTLGALRLQHRVVLAPLTRYKATEKTHIPNVPIMKEYYAQRASEPGTLLISEATLIAQKAGVYKNVPGIWCEEQAVAWKEITDAVHARGCFMFCQLWALGRAADYNALREEDPSLPFVGASDIQLSEQPADAPPPRPLTIAEIQDYIQQYVQAASLAVRQAGFDGVEIHAANGYLVDQFLQSTSNNRTDAYGGSVENRARFALEIVDAVAAVVGPERTAIRISPWSQFQDMRMQDPVPTFAYLVSQLKLRQRGLAFLHAVEPRIYGGSDGDARDGNESNDFLRALWAPKPFIAAGGFNRDSAMASADKKGDLVAFGRAFLSNPDIVKKMRTNTTLTPYHRATFFIPGDLTGIGYTDYPFADSEV